MGISPIPSLIPLMITQPVQMEIELPPMTKVENTARSGDETYSPGSGESAGGSEEGFGPQEDSDEGETESTASPTSKAEDRQISFFA
jgi:hypothetical protein